MNRVIALGCGVLFAVAAGCGGGGSKPGGTGGSGTGGIGTGGTGTAGAGTAGAGTAGAGGTGTAGAGGAGARTVMLMSADALAFAAGQDGDGAWQALTAAGAAQTFTLQVTGARYGLAYGCANAAGDSIGITVVQATVAETARVTVACGGLSTATPVTIMGTISGLSSTQSAQVDVAGRAATVAAGTTTYSVSLPPGTWDLFARRMTAAPVWDRMIRRNSVTAAAGATFNLDFTTEGFAPETHTITFQGVSATESTGQLVIFRNTLGGSPFGLGSPAAGSYFAIPAAQLRSGDYHSVVASASDATAGRRVRRIFTTAMDFTATMPPMVAAPVITVGAATPYVRPRATIPDGLTANRYDLGYSQTETAPARSRSWALQLTSGWIDAGAETDYVVPDLSAVTGWQAWWGLAAGVSTNWQQFSQSSDAGVSDLLRADQTTAELDGREYKITQRDGMMTF